MPFPGPIGGDLLARRYRLIDRVGSGGMSVVWRARDEVLDRLVAVKWLGTELADDDFYRDLVRREAWATARIKHPAVAAVYDYGEVSDHHGQSLAYVVMEMLDGESLSDRLRRGPIPWREALAIGAEVADALATAHEHGVVHRDVSPDNIMLTSSGLRVFDFGIAAPIGEPDDDATGSTFGTPAYIAPERLDGQPAQTATDVYSLGVLLFEMLTGHPPFPEDTWTADAAARARVAPRVRGVAGLPVGVGKLAQRCLVHDPPARPTAREVARRLAAYRRPGRRVALIASVVTLAAVLTVVVALAPWPSSGVHGAAAPTPSSPLSTVAGSPTPTPTAPNGGPPSQPAGGQPPAGASIPVEQALDGLRATIDDAATGGMGADIAEDLRNYVENQIAMPLSGNPSANVKPVIDLLVTKVNTRWTERDALGNRRVSDAQKAELLGALSTLNTALGYPHLA